MKERKRDYRQKYSFLEKVFLGLTALFAITAALCFMGIIK